MQYTQIRKFWDRAQSGGRKSVRLEELDPEWFFQLKNGYFVPYLDLIQKIWKRGIDRILQSPYNYKQVLTW